MNSQSEKRPLLTHTEVKHRILDGIESANQTYERWSGGWHVSDYGVESVVAVHVAAALFEAVERVGGRISMENSCEDLAKVALSQRVKSWPLGGVLPASQRPDIVAWLPSKGVDAGQIRVQSAVPVGIVEVKRQWIIKDCRTDLQRIRSMLSMFGKAANGTMEWGAFAVFISKETKDGSAIRRVQERLHAMKAEAEGEGWKYDIAFGRTYAYDFEKFGFPDWKDYQCASACILVTQNV